MAINRDVFISYSSHDKDRVNIIVKELEQNGISCWFAPRNISPGETWASAITEALQAAKVVVLIYTHESNASQQVLNEINLANASNKAIIPFRLCDEPMNDQLAYYLARMQWVDASSHSFYDDVVVLRNRLLEQLAQKNGSNKNIEPYAYPGLWWTSLESDGMFAIFPKQTWYWQTILLAAMAVLLVVIPTNHLRYLTVPFLLIGFNLSSSSLMGKHGLKLTMPLVAYAFSAVAWMLSYTGVGTRISTMTTAIASGSLLLLIAICSAHLPKAKRDGQDAMLLMSAFVSVCMYGCAFAFKKGLLDKSSAQFFTAILYSLPVIQSVLLYYKQRKEVSLGRPANTDGHQFIERFAMFALGFVPLILSSFLDGVGVIAVLLVTLIAYAALGILSFAKLKRSARDFGALFVPASIASTVALLAQAKSRYMPLSAYVKVAIAFCRNSMPGKVLGFMGTPFVKAFSWLLGKPITALCVLITSSSAKSIPTLLVNVLCLLASLIVVASIVGIAVSLFIRIRANKKETVDQAARADSVS